MVKFSGRSLDATNNERYTQTTKSVAITVSGGNIEKVNGGGMNGPEDNWGTADAVHVGTVTMTLLGGHVGEVYGGGYNAQWVYTYKMDDEAGLVFSNYNGTTTTNVLNTTDNVTMNVRDGANIGTLYMGGRGYSNVKSTTANILGGTIGTMATSGSYGYTESADANISGGTIDNLELVHRNYVGDIDLDVTGGTVNAFHAGTGGAYKNKNLTENKDYNIATIAILGNVDIKIASGTVKASYLTTGLEWADSVTCNVPLTMKTMYLVGQEDYEGTQKYSGQFETEKTDALWDATIILTDVESDETPQSFTPSTNVQNNLVYGSADQGKIVTSNGDGKRTLTSVSSGSTGNVAALNNNYFETLEDAYKVANNGDTITLLAKCSGTLTVSKEITIVCGAYGNDLTIPQAQDTI